MSSLPGTNVADGAIKTLNKAYGPQTFGLAVVIVVVAVFVISWKMIGQPAFEGAVAVAKESTRQAVEQTKQSAETTKQAEAMKSVAASLEMVSTSMNERSKVLDRVTDRLDRVTERLIKSP